VFLLAAPLSAQPTFDNSEVLLDKVQQSAFSFLWREANPKNGLVKDRAGNFANDDYKVGSIASVGFALAALPIGVERGWISRKDAKKRALATFRFFLNAAQEEKGFFYHFLGMNTGRRTWKCELSSIDTAIFIAGAIVASEYFKDSTLSNYVTKLYDRIDFEWMLNGGKTLSMGWKPKTGFLKERWSEYNEGIMLTLLALASKTHPVPPETWDMIKRKKGVYQGIAVIQSPPLFTHQYPHLFFDFRNKHDKYADYFENSRNATKANYKFCMNQSARYDTFRQGYWGLTASDGPGGYKAYGAEPGGALTDGTVAPTAAFTSIMFTPEISLEAIHRLYKNEKDWLWGKYGFTDSFNMKPKWKSPDVIGIDLGALLLGIENYRTGLIWNLFSNSDIARRAFEVAGFKEGKKAITLPKPPVYSVEPFSKDRGWKDIPQIHLTDVQFLEIGEPSGMEDLDISAQFMWDNEYLRFRVLVSDDDHRSNKGGSYIWKNDCFELFVDPTGKGLEWGKSRYFQIGISPTSDFGGVKTWAWFQNQDPVKKGNLEAQVEKLTGKYMIAGKIKWSFLGIKPKKGKLVSVTPAFHDIDSKTGSEKKYTWHFVSNDGRFDLGKFILK